MDAKALDTMGLARAAVALLGAPGADHNGLTGLLAAFERAGLGAAFRSWVGIGPNDPITPAELERALGAEALAQLARSAGIEPQRLVAGLAAVLPRVVDQLTPDGSLPAGRPHGASRGSA